MPRIPTFSAQLAPSGTVTPAVGSAPDLSGLTGGITAAAAKMDALRQHQELQSQQLAQNEARVAIVNTMSQAHSMWTEKLTTAKQQAPDGAPGFTSGVLKDFDTWAKTAVDTAPQLGRQLLQERIAEFRTGVHAQAFDFETRQRQAKLATDFDNGLDTDRRVVWADEKQFPLALANRVSLVRSMPFAGDVRQKLEDKAVQGLAYSAAIGSVERDPDAMLRRLGIEPGKWMPGTPLPDTSAAVEAVKHDPIMSNLAPENLEAVLHRALSLSASRDAAGRAALDKAQKEAEEALKGLQKFVLTGELASPDYQAEVLGKTQLFPQMHAIAQGLFSQSVSGAAFGSRSLPEQRAILTTINAKAGAQGTSPEEQQVIGQAREINRAQEEAYKDNPWSAATRFHRLPATPEMNFDNAEAVPQLVAQRLRLMGDVEARAGRPVSPCSRARRPASPIRSRRCRRRSARKCSARSARS